MTNDHDWSPHKKHQECSDAEETIGRYRVALERIVRGEEEAPVGMSNPAAIARAALDERAKNE